MKGLRYVVLTATQLCKIWCMAHFSQSFGDAMEHGWRFHKVYWSSMSLSLDNANQMVSTYCVWIVLICRFSLHGHNVSWLIHTPQIGDPCDYPRLKTFIVKRSPSVVGDHSPYDICKSLCCMTGNQTPTNAQECYRSPCLLFGVFDRIWLNNNLNTCLGATH